jgi:hypothetical protein
MTIQNGLINNLLFLVAQWYFIVWLYISICLPIEGHLDCLQFLVISNKAVITFVVRFLYEHKFSFL